MRSLPAAMTWELLRRDWWALAAATLTAFALPTIILTALAHDGAVDPADQSMLILHMVMVHLNAFVVGAALVATSWNMSRLYAYPATTAALTAWRVLPAMLLIAVETVVWTAALNLAFQLDWPLWGPALFSAVAVAAVIASFWIVGNSRWVIFVFTVTGTVLGLWFKSRYGQMFGHPTHYWQAITPAEFFTLFAFAAVSLFVAYRGLARNRRGEPPFSLGVITWLDRLVDRLFAAKITARTPAQAQAWYVWQHAWLMPAAMFAAAIVGLVIWFFSSLDPSDLVAGAFIANRLLMPLAAVGGAALGNLGSPKDLAMGQFLATRPMTDADMARIVLRVAMKSLLLAWAAWAVLLLLIDGSAYLLSDASLAYVPKEASLRELPASFVASWIVLGCFIAAMLTGRSKVFTRTLTLGGLGYIAVVLLIKFTLSRPAQAFAFGALAFAFGAALVVGAVWAFIAAHRRQLIAAPTAWASLAVVVLLLTCAELLFSHHPPLPAPSYALIVGLLTLTVVPVAASPLAVAWNRHR
jgi:hypothetical protein